MPYPGMRPPRFLRARRPRPSERITFRVISGPSPLGHLTLDSPSPRRGGLRTPAKEGIAPNPKLPPFWPRACRQLVRNHDVPRLASGLATRARRPRPSEENASRVISRFSPLGHASLPGGAGSARPQRRHRPHPGISPLGPRPQRPRPHALRKDKLEPAR
jgi:hypothetical protein